ncbi:leucine-rich repeat-containing protein 46 isoform X2 [Rhinoderma darwinii]
MVKEAHSLYLQENQIKKIENVDVVKNLRFLSLSSNKVQHIQNLQCLTNLQFLDVSHNLIKKLDASELPHSLLILDLTGNPCTKATDYRQHVLEALPFLQQLDGSTVRDSVNQGSLSDNEEEEDDRNSDDSDEPFDVSGLSSMSQEMIQRSYRRRHMALREHEERLSELNDTLDKQSLIPPRNDPGNAEFFSMQQATSCTTKPQNSIISEKGHQNSTLMKKELKHQQNNGTVMPASKPMSKNQVPASSCPSRPGKPIMGLNKSSSEKKPPSAPQPKTNTVSTGKTHGTVTASQKERPATSAPSTRKMCAVPTKSTLQASENTSAGHSPTTASSRPQNERQTTSAPTKKTLQSPQKLTITRLKVNSSAQSTRKKPS